ncbi:MAG TPA: FAD-dependent oxidoreductase [Frankiaceae bacterium]|nr:FAD-dependent oxidoreductase [Frankiaceae bacterium]
MSPAVTRRDWDALVVGGGAAGLSAALWLARYRRRTLVVDAQEWRSASVEVTHGYLGRDPTRPADLLAAGRRELARYPDARYRTGRVTAARRCGAGPFELALAGEVAPLHPRHVVLATGCATASPPWRTSPSTTARPRSTARRATATRRVAGTWWRWAGTPGSPGSPRPCGRGRPR